MQAAVEATWERPAVSYETRIVPIIRPDENAVKGEGTWDKLFTLLHWLQPGITEIISQGEAPRVLEYALDHFRGHFLHVLVLQLETAIQRMDLPMSSLHIEAGPYEGTHVTAFRITIR